MTRLPDIAGTVVALAALQSAVAAPETVVSGSPWTVLDDLEVTAPQWVEPWADHALGNVSWLELPGVSLNAQGGGYGQNDFSIRGSSFSGAGYSLGGLALRQPQTEHFNAELPLPPEWFEAPRLLTGLSQALESSSHPVGSIGLNLVPAPTGGSLLLRGGERGLFGSRLSQHISQRVGEAGQLSVGVFGLAEDADEVDFDSNSAERRAGGGRLQYLASQTQFDLLVATQNRRFGARGYYGVTPSLDAREEIDDLLSFASLQRRYGQDGYLRASLLWRQLDDYYLLHVPGPTPYENRHRTHIAASAIDGCHVFTGSFLINWRAVLEREDIESARLGDRDRTRAEFRAIPQISLGQLDLYAGLGGYVLQDEDNRVAPIAGARLQLGGGWRLLADYVQTLRQPSYTELNYESPGSLGNAGLESERTDAVECGIQKRAESFNVRLVAFFRRTQHTVDWIKATAATNAWTATDVGDVNCRGVEGLMRWQPFPSLALQGSYVGLEKDNHLDPFAARYVLDYARHAGNLAIDWKPCSAFRLIYAHSARRYESNALRANDTATSGDVAVYLSHPDHDRFVLGLGCDNIWDDNDEIVIGVPSDARRAWVSFSAEWL